MGQNLRALREKRGLEQSALAARSGIPQTTISRIEKGGAEPGVLKVTALADALDCDVDYLTWEPVRFAAALSLIAAAEPLRAEKRTDGPAVREPMFTTWAYATPPEGLHRVPVVGVFRVMADGSFDETPLEGSGGGYVPGAPTDGVHAVRIKGDALAPKWKDGCFLLLRPGAKPATEQPVVAVMRDGRRFVRELTFERPDSYVLSNLTNPQDRITVDKADVESLIPVVGEVYATEWIRA